MRPLRIALASLLLVAGCSTSEAGAPVPAGDPASTTEQTGEPTETTETPTSSTTVEGPNRPKDIDVATVDPCALLTKMPVRKYGLDGRAPVDTTSSMFPGSKACYSGGIDKNLGLTLVAVKDKGAGEFLETANAEVTEFDAQGYPLYVLRNEQVVGLCLAVLDVHDGQFIWISYGVSLTGDGPQTPVSKLCKTVPVIAASTITALG
jgi:hypothetical protein